MACGGLQGGLDEHNGMVLLEHAEHAELGEAGKQAPDSNHLDVLTQNT